MKIRKIAITLIIICILIICIFEIGTLILKKLYPMEYAEYVSKYSKEYNVDEKWIYALIKAESNFDTNSVSQSGAVGLMQLMETTAEEVASDIGIETVNLKEPECNIQIGTKYFTDLIKYYEGNYHLAIVAYNAGIGTVAKWISNGIIKEDGSDIENIPYKETNNYIRKVLKNYRTYQELY